MKTLQKTASSKQSRHRRDALHVNPRGAGRIPTRVRDLTPKEAQMLADHELSAFYASDVRLALGGER